MPRQRINHSRRTKAFPEGFSERLKRFHEESGLSWSEIARRIGTFRPTGAGRERRTTGAWRSPACRGRSLRAGRGLNRHTIRRWNAGAPPNGRHMMHMTALLEMADTLCLGHPLTARDGWQEARCGTPDSTGNNGAPETVCRGGRQPPISR